MKRVSDFPERFFGRHFSTGVVEYPALKKRVFISTEVAKEMDPSFSGKPLFVQHRDDYDIDKLPIEADGVVVKSFYNTLDGKHWVEFMVSTDEAKQKIMEGWLLSNSYKANVDEIGGESKNVSYDASVMSADYHHMALVPKPRYEDSVIYTPEQFKQYNDKLKAQLEHLQNSKDEEPIMFFKKTKAENSDALKDMSVKLPKSGVEVGVMQLINEADEKEVKKDEKKYANESDLVKVGDEEVTVAELVAKIIELAEDVEEVVEEEKKDESEVEEQLENKDDKEEKKEKLDNSKAPKFASLKLKNESDKGLQIETYKPVAYSSMQSQLDLGKSKY